jgi:hypothetical protein
MKFALFASIGALAVLAACATPNNGRSLHFANLDYLTAPRTCAVFSGNMGSRFSDLRIQRTWNEVDRQVSDYLFESLSNGGFRVVRASVPPSEPAANIEAVLETVARNKCAKLIQITLQVNEDSGKRQFGFDVDVIRFIPKDKDKVVNRESNATTLSEFRKEYRYPRTEEGLKNFYTGKFASQVFYDLSDSGALENLKKSSR